MPVDKKLFLYDLAVVAILKNEAPYLQEWLDYHLAAGVNHFYLYDNDSPDNQREVAEPYIAAGVVDYINAPGQVMQMVAYNDAVNRFKFRCRYMAFIDLDEFIYPKTNRSIVEVVDEILNDLPDAAGLAINWQLFGSNGQDKADTSRGVLERFTRRAPTDFSANTHVKTIANPRAINFLNNAHFAFYFEGLRAVNEQGQTVETAFNQPVTADKIVVNHYYTKSREEYAVKRNRGRADIPQNTYNLEELKFMDRNEVFDDDILNYRAERAKNLSLEDDEQRLRRVIDALAKNLSAYASDTSPADKAETALTCVALSSYLREKFPDIERMKLYQEVSLTALLKSFDDAKLWEARLLLRELPNLLSLPYPAVKDLRDACRQLLKQLTNIFHMNTAWKNYVELDYLQRLLKNFKE